MIFKKELVPRGGLAFRFFEQHYHLQILLEEKVCAWDDPNWCRMGYDLCTSSQKNQCSWSQPQGGHDA